MKPARPTPAWPARILLALGAGSAAVLIGVSLLDFGDPGAAVLERLEREAVGYERLLQERWLSTRASPWPVTSSTEIRQQAGDPDVRPGPCLTDAKEESEDALRLVGARSSLARGDLEAAQGLFMQVLESGSDRSGEALLALCTATELRPMCVERFGEFSGQVPWTACVDGTSGRLLALLSVGSELSSEERSRWSTELEEALSAGAVALPAPQDAASVQAGVTEWQFEMDPWWTALQERVESTVEIRMDDRDRWKRAFRVTERKRLAVMEEAFPPERPADSHWRVRRVAQDVWMSCGIEAGVKTVGLYRPSELSTAILGSTSHDGDLVALLQDVETEENLLGAAEPLTAVTGPEPLEGTDLALVIGHPDPAGLVEASRARLAFVRYGLLVLAALLLGTTVLAARLVTRARHLQTLRSTFVASVSHDLRTPLASIRLMADNLGAGYAKGREERYAASIQRETLRLGRLVDDLLDFGRIERGLAPALRREEVDIQSWLDRYAAAERTRCAAASCAFSLETRGELGTASLDLNALERALSNLVDNSIKHGAAGTVRLRAERTAEELLEIVVEDEGRGFTRGTVHEHLFDPFRRDSDTEGTGLGLTIARAIAEGHGGAARLTSGPDGRGARATLSIPTATHSAA